MHRLLTLCLVLLVALVTGCPRNKYVLELTPHGDALERMLTFHREDGADTNGVPKYQDFPEAELTAIKALYPPGDVKEEGKRYVARSEFSGAMPKDVGGAGDWTNMMTSMGSAGIYTERFRGNDDLATTSGKKLQAADQVTDLLIGWSRQELGKEPQYGKLRQFLDVDFRRDLKNLSLYHWVGGMSANLNPKAQEEFVVRFGQYLSERGYLSLNQLPELFAIFAREDYNALMQLIQHLIARKMGLPESAPAPASFAFLATAGAAEASLDKFMATSDAYRERTNKWAEEKKTNPDAKEPRPSDIIEESLATLIDFRLFGSDDHLVVKLSLPAPPIRTNGKWDESLHQVLWESDLKDQEQTQRLPAFCYAAWCNTNETFQKQHFGKVILEGEELLQYCLWHASLSSKQAGEWETLLTDLKADAAVAGKLEAFRFSDEPVAVPAKEGKKIDLVSDFPRSLLKSALEQKPKAAAK